MWPTFSKACRLDVDRVLRSGRLTAYKANGKRLEPDEGSEAYEFEREVERKFKVKHAVAVNSGTAALHASLVALGVAGREVVTSPFTFSATASAILLAGGIPVFCDVDPHTFCITAKEVARVITKRTAAILPVHLFGYFPDLTDLQSLGLPIIEDSCQAVGASRGGDGGGPLHQRKRYVGTVGLVGAYSFNGSKNVPAGEGGCLVTNDAKVAEKARLLVNHGCNFGWEKVGYNYRLTEITACVARWGLRALDVRNERRRKLVRDVWWELGSPPWFQRVHPSRTHVYYVAAMTVKAGARSCFIRRCARRGLHVQESYTTPLHHLPAFRRFCDRELPVVDELHRESLCLLTNLTPDKPLSYARWCAKVVRESLE